MRKKRGTKGIKNRYTSLKDESHVVGGGQIRVSYVSWIESGTCVMHAVSSRNTSENLAEISHLLSEKTKVLNL